MSKDWHLMRENTIDPRTLVGEAFGEFGWQKWDKGQARWSFTSEENRERFRKKYGGECVLSVPATTYPWDRPADHPPADPDAEYCDMSSAYVVDRSGFRTPVYRRFKP